jgi:predicted small secreted protein
MQMLKFRKTVKAVVVMSALLAALSACQKQEGPAERAGKEADKAMGKVGQQIEKAGESIQDAAKGEKKN